MYNYAPINVSPHPPLAGEVRQSWGFDLIRIQLPHPPGSIRIQITPSYMRAYTGSDRGIDGTLTYIIIRNYAPFNFHAGARARAHVQSHTCYIFNNNNNIIHIY